MNNRRSTLNHADLIVRHSALLALACLFFFSCYTLTPLYQPGSGQAGANDQLADKDHQRQTVRMLLWDLVAAKLAQEDTSSALPVTVHVLLKKRRAVLNSGTVPDISLQPSAPLAEDQGGNLPAFSDIRCSISSLGYYARYSGLSPPCMLAVVHPHVS